MATEKPLLSKTFGSHYWGVVGVGECEGRLR
jgi:hypothetical protein